MTDFRGTGRRYNVNISGEHAAFLTADVTGDKELAAKLLQFRDSGARRVMVAAVRASTREGAKYLKSVAPRKDIKREIGWRTQRLSSPNTAIAKAGVGVGKRPMRMYHADRAAVAAGGGSKGAIKAQKRKGLSAYSSSAILWIVLGTVRRYTERGAYRGRMSRTFSVQKAMQPGLGRTRDAARNAAMKQLEK